MTALRLPLGQIIAQANRVLCESSLAGQYATLVCGPASDTGELEIHNAGHLPVIVSRRTGALQIESMGFPLGMFCEGEFPVSRLKLEAGDTLFIYSDGLSEADGAGEEYGVDRVARFVQDQSGRQAAELIAACLDDLRTFTGGGPQTDDLTVLAIQRRC